MQLSLICIIHSTRIFLSVFNHVNKIQCREKLWSSSLWSFIHTVDDSLYQPTNASNKLQQNTNDKIRFMTSIKLPHVWETEW